jgi:hypothetical protein
MTQRRNKHVPRRRAVVLVFFAVMLLVIVGMVAFALDVGRMVLVRTQLQAAADSAAIAAASQLGGSYDDVYQLAHDIAKEHHTANVPVEVPKKDVEIGVWDARTRTFTPSDEQTGNAVRVRTYRDAAHGGDVPMSFGRVLRLLSFRASASAVAMANPRDIAFVVDLSGSMNDDTEPCWATSAINTRFAPAGYSDVGSELVRDVFEDFEFGAYPNALEYVGRPWGVAQDQYAYANLTKNGGPLTASSIPSKYRIISSDDEATRKRKAYSIIIDQQLARIMPQARPTPNSATNYAYWEKYLDYMMTSVNVKSGTGSPPQNRGKTPPNQGPDIVNNFYNPNTDLYPSASKPTGYQNRLGYLTYVQFMMDHGRDLPPTGSIYTPLSQHSSECKRHDETTAGGTFSFSAREQPAHASRRAIIAAIEVIRQRNELIEDPNQRDWVSIVSYDALINGGPVIRQRLTANYQEAMEACTDLQAVADNYSGSTATDAGLMTAREHIRSKQDGGEGRRGTDKVVVLLTDGVPNLTAADPVEVSRYIAAHPSGDYYTSGKTAYNSPLVQAAGMQAEHWMVFPVAIGLGADYGFMDRMARLGGTANEGGQSSRGSGNPAEYEQRLIEIFEKIITSPQVRLVQ